jgi:pyrroloquinoline quinone biosynthesis protein B
VRQPEQEYLHYLLCMNRLFHFTYLVALLIACRPSDKKDSTEMNEFRSPETVTATSLIVLGTVQDGGSPHIGCSKACCQDLFDRPDPERMVVSLGIIDPENKMNWLIEATPDMPKQLNMLQTFSSFKDTHQPDGIFLTHAHIGHYAGLIYLGREALGASDLKVYAMPRMKTFLETNGPWSQLVDLKNIQLQLLQDDQAIQLSSNITITPFRVPHRDEYSETVGFRIEGPNKKVLFIPDIDKWHEWERSIVEEISKVDYALLDATFFNNDEINNRDMNEIPHPFVVESLELFSNLPEEEKAKIHFIHFNHTNPLLNKNSIQYQQVKKAGIKLASPMDLLPL